MRLYGKAKLELRELGNGERRKKRAAWVVSGEPYVLMRLKRLFQRIDKGELGEVVLAHSPETCRELLWFSERFPLEFDPRSELDAGAAAHRAREEMVGQILGGTYRPPDFDLVYPPREYQRVAATLYLKSGGLLLADDLGLGKTVSAIAALTDKRTLPAVVVTLTHLPTQWQREINRFAPNLRVHVMKKGTYEDLRAKYRGRFPDVVIGNYHKLSGWAEYLAPQIHSVIFDEVQELRRGESSEKYKAAKWLAESASFRLGLSATPFYNYGEEMHPVLDVLSPGAVGTREEFLREWCSTHGEHHVIREPKVFGAYCRDQGLMLRRTRRDVGRELPDLQRIQHHVEADAKPLEAVAGAAAELARIILAETEVKRGSKREASGQLDWRLRQATGVAKAPYVADFVRMLVEGGEKVLLYGWHREVYGIWEQRLRDLMPSFFTGEESQAQKARALEYFKGGQTKVLVMSLRAGAGVDGLQHDCRTVVFGELDWSSGVHEQCIGRVHRDGQDEPVTAYYLVSDSGSDPVVAGVLGLKSQQLEQVRDPNAPLVTEVQLDPDHIKKLAEQFLKQRTDGRAA